jgi:glycosyltransferase involved in cell wall biosynthesis
VRVGLLADRLNRSRTTGVGTYIAGISKGLAELQTAHDFVLFDRRDQPIRRIMSAAVGHPRITGDPPFDVLHVLVPTMPVGTNLPLVVTIHDLMPLKHPHYFPPRDRWLYRLAMRQVRRQAAQVVADSEATAHDVVRLLGIPQRRVTVAHLGEPLDLQLPAEDQIEPVLKRFGLDRTPYIIFVGELSTRKNSLGLVEAFHRIAGECPELRLVFVGSARIGSDEVRRFVRDHGLEQQVKFLGHVDRETVPVLLSRAAAMALPSEDEGFGIPAVEAMTCGTPLIVSDRGSLPEVVGDAAVVVPYGDVAALAGALRALAENGDARARLAQAGRKRASRFSWRRTAELTLGVYERTVGAAA